MYGSGIINSLSSAFTRSINGVVYSNLWPYVTETLSYYSTRFVQYVMKGDPELDLKMDYREYPFFLIGKEENPTYRNKLKGIYLYRTTTCRLNVLIVHKENSPEAGEVVDFENFPNESSISKSLDALDWPLEGFRRVAAIDEIGRQVAKRSRYFNGTALGGQLTHTAISSTNKIGKILGENGIEAVDGVARRDFYWFNYPNFLWTGFDLKFLRVFTFMAVGGEHMKHYMDIDQGTRGLFKLPRLLVGLPNFVDKDFTDKNARAEKRALKAHLFANNKSLFLATRTIASDLPASWNSSDCVENNMGQFVLKIIARAYFNIEEIDEALFSYVRDFEELWHNPDERSAHDFNRIRDFFRHASVDMHRQRTQNRTDPQAVDIVDLLYDFHKHSLGMKGFEDVNIAAFFAIFGNLPKLMRWQAVLGFGDPGFRQALKNECHRLDKLIVSENERRRQALAEAASQPSNENKSDPQDSTKTALEQEMAPYSEDALKFMQKHSPLLKQFFYETIRLGFRRAVFPRINSNLFFGEARFGTKPYTQLPTRSFAINADEDLANLSRLESPRTFNPLRKAYGDKKFCRQVLRIFGHESADRVCPGKYASELAFIAIAHAFATQPLEQAIKQMETERAQLLDIDYFPPPKQAADMQKSVSLASGSTHLQEVTFEEALPSGP